MSDINNMSRENLVAIAKELNISLNLGIERVSRLTTPAIIRLLKKHSAPTSIGNSQAITTNEQVEIGAEPEAATEITNEPAKNRKPREKSRVRKAGVVNYLEDLCITIANSDVTICIEELHSIIKEAFPDRDPHKLLATVKAFVPFRFRRERGLIFEKVSKERGGTYKVRLAQKMLMNTATGAVATEEEWRADFESMDVEAWGSDTFEGAGLIEVEPDGEGGWRGGDNSN